MSTSAELKKIADDFFRQKDYTSAIESYTAAINAAGTDSEKAVLFSNRSATYLSSLDFDSALNDAKSAIEISPEFGRAYGRAASASYAKGLYDDAISFYEKYLRIEPENASALKGLKEAKLAKSKPVSDMENDLFGGMQNDSELMAAISDPAFMQALMANDMKTLSLPKFAKAMAFMNKLQNEQEKNGAPSAPQQTESKAEESTKAAEPMDVEPTPEVQAESQPAQADSDLSQKRAEDSDAKEKSIKLKEEGNKFYKQKDFKKAIELYTQAYELHKDVLYLTNIAAAHSESGNSDEAIKILEEALDVSRETHASYTIVGKVYHKLSNVYSKIGNDEEALKYIKKSLTEDRNPTVLQKKKALEKKIKIQKQESYLDKDKALESSTKGKELFSKQNYAEAVKMFDEAIKRDPTDYKHYSNRSACLFKLLAFPDAIKDCDVVISKDPTFTKAYLRKAQSLLAMQRYAAAIITLAKAVEAQPDPSKLAEVYKVKQDIKSAMDRRIREGSVSREDIMQAALAEPEVRDIVSDPVMANILEQAKSNPSVIMEHYSNPEFRSKIELLADVGIISVG